MTAVANDEMYFDNANLNVIYLNQKTPLSCEQFPFQKKSNSYLSRSSGTRIAFVKKSNAITTFYRTFYREHNQ